MVDGAKEELEAGVGRHGCPKYSLEECEHSLQGGVDYTQGRGHRALNGSQCGATQKAMKLQQLLVVCALITWRLLRAVGAEPRRSLRLAKKKVTMGRQGTMDNPEVLPYYMEAVESGYARTRERGLRNMSEEEDIPGEVFDRDSINTEEHGDPWRSSRTVACPDCSGWLPPWVGDIQLHTG